MLEKIDTSLNSTESISCDTKTKISENPLPSNNHNFTNNNYSNNIYYSNNNNKNEQEEEKYNNNNNSNIITTSSSFSPSPPSPPPLSSPPINNNNNNNNNIITSTSNIPPPPPPSPPSPPLCQSSVCSKSNISTPSRFQAALIMAAVFFSGLWTNNAAKTTPNSGGGGGETTSHSTATASGGLRSTSHTPNNGGGVLYALPVDSHEAPARDETPVYRRVYTDSHTPIKTFPVLQQRCIWDLLERGADKFGDKKFLGRRPLDKQTGEALDFTYISFKQVRELASIFGSALRTLDGEVPVSHLEEEKYQQNFRFVGIWSVNRIEWAVTDFATNGYGMVSVPLYDTLGDESMRHIIKTTNMTTICLEGKKVDRALGYASEIKHIKTLISFDPLTDEQKKKAKDLGIGLYEYHHLIQEYRPLDKRVDATPVRDDEIYSVIYTSGTTGIPKGVMLSSGNMMAFVAGYVQVHTLTPGKEHSILGFLPLAHIAERCAEVACLYLGMSIGYFQGDTTKIADDFQKLRPTLWLGVPRVYSKFLDAVFKKVDMKGGLLRSAFYSAYNCKLSRLNSTGNFKHRIWDWLLFRKIRQSVGGNVELVATGGAPTSPDAMRSQSVLLSVPVIQMWGMTEACVVIIQSPKDGDPTCIGGPIPTVEYKVVSVPEKEYSVYDDPPRGELWLRGPTIMKGYLLDGERTSAALTHDGWLRTGDIVKLKNNGGLVLIDRLKNIFKMQQGEYVAPEKVEIAYGNCKIIEQIYVHGSSLEVFLVAVVVLNEAAVKAWAQDHDKGTKSYSELIGDVDLKNAVLAEMKEQEKELNGFEKVKDIYIIEEPFTIENNLMSPSLKTIRPKVYEKYQQEIAELYQHAKNKLL